MRDVVHEDNQYEPQMFSDVQPTEADVAYQRCNLNVTGKSSACTCYSNISLFQYTTERRRTTKYL